MSATNDSIGLETLALLAFFATMPIYSPNVVALQGCLDNSDVMSAFVNSMMGASILASTAYLAMSLFRLDAVQDHARSISIAGCALYAVGMTLFLITCAVTDLEITAIAGGAGCITGVGLSIMAVTWGARLSLYGLKRALLLVCVICGSTAAINWVFSFLPDMPLVAITAVLTAIGTFYPLFVPAQHHPSPQTPTESVHALKEGGDIHDTALRGAFSESSSSPLGASTSRIDMMKRFISVLAPALTGLSMFAFFMGVSRVTVFDNMHAEVLGNVFAAVLLLPLCFSTSKRPFLAVLCNVALPLVACAMLCITVLAYDFGLFAALVPLGSYTFFCAVAQISLALGVASMRPREFPPCITWTFYLLLFSLFSAFGLLFGHPSAFGQTEFLSSSLLALYCSALIVYAIFELMRDTLPVQEANTPSVEEASSFEERCDDLAQKFGLSPREREIIAFLGRGHTSAYVAKSLIISESTVYTHTRNIYRKLGMSSKEEIIQALSDPRDAHF